MPKDPNLVWHNYMARLQIAESHDKAPDCDACSALDDSIQEDWGVLYCGMEKGDGLFRTIKIDNEGDPINPERCPRRRPKDWPCTAGVCDHE